MVVLGVLIGIAEVVLGIIVLANSQHQAILIGTGIGYILSGVLFIWLCAGAQLAHENKAAIDTLKQENENLKKEVESLKDKIK